MDRQEYLDYVAEHSPRTCEWRTLLFAFLIGGAICALGEGIGVLFTMWTGIEDIRTVGMVTSMALVILASLLTALGLYDDIGKVAGAGSIVPITGFANSIVSPAMEYNREGVVYGVMSKMFVIAGPVIVSAVTMSVIAGIIYMAVGV